MAHEARPAAHRRNRGEFMRYHRALAASVAAAALITPLLMASLPASAAGQAAGTHVRGGHKHGQSASGMPALPAPPRPRRSHPRPPAGYQAPTALTHKRDAAGRIRAAATPAHAKTWGGSRAGHHAGALRQHQHLGLARRAVRDRGRQPGQPLRQGDRRAGGRLRLRPGEQLHRHHLHRLDLQRADPRRVPQRRAVHHPPGDLGRRTTSGSCPAPRAAPPTRPSRPSTAGTRPTPTSTPPTTRPRSPTRARRSPATPNNGAEVLAPDITNPAAVTVLGPGQLHRRQRHARSTARRSPRPRAPASRGRSGRPT